MALAVVFNDYVVTDGSSQFVEEVLGGPVVVVAHVDCSELVSGDTLVIRWQGSVGTNGVMLWSQTVVATGSESVITTPPLPIVLGGHLEVEQTAGTTGKSIGATIFSL